MTLEFQQVPIPFAQGIDTLPHKFAIPIGKLADLENGVFDHAGAINMRNGYAKLPQTIFGGVGKIRSAKRLATFHDTLVLLDGEKVYAYVPSAESWVDRGSCVACRGSASDMSSQSGEVYRPDYAYHDGAEAIVWQSIPTGHTYGFIRYSVRDHEGAVIVSDEFLASAGGVSPKVVYFGGLFRAFWISTQSYYGLNHVMVSSFSDDDPGAVNRANLGLVSSYVYSSIDVSVVSETLCLIVAGKGLNSGWTARLIDSSLATVSEVSSGTSTTLSLACTAGETAGSYWIASGETATVTVSYWDTVASALYSTSLAAYGLRQGSYGAEYYVWNVAVVRDGATVRLFWEEWSTATSTIKTVVTALLTIVAGPTVYISGYSVVMKGVGMTGKPFAVDGVFYVPVATDSLGVTDTSGNGTEATHFLVTSDGAIVGRHSYAKAGKYRARNSLSETIEVSDGVWKNACTRKSSLSSSGGVVSASTNAAVSTWDLASAGVTTEFMAGQLLISSGLLRSFDGEQCVEHGFLAYPENISAALSHSAGTLASDTYEYSCAYRWTDAVGQIHESAPSPSVSVVVTGPVSQVVLTLPTLRVTEKSNVKIVVFRDRGVLSGDSTFYKLGEVDNDTSVNSVEFTDTGSVDATLASNEFLYTTGGVLENTPPPDGHMLAVTNGRAWVSDGELVWPSKIVAEGRPVEFCDTTYIRLSPKGGAIVAMAHMDASLIAFKQYSAMFQIWGDGPDNLGSGSFPEPTLIPTDAGCMSAASVTATSDGLLFQGTDGFSLLSRAFATTYIGGEVRDYEKQTVTATTIIPGSGEVRWLCSDGPALVRNSFFQQWGKFTIQGTTACLWQGNYVFAKSDGTVWQETPGVFLDDTTPVEMAIETPWLNFAGLQGYQRVRKMLLIADWLGPNTVTVKTQHDYIPQWGTEVVIDATAWGSTFGTKALYGSNGLYGLTQGLTNIPEQATVHLTVQKTQAVKVRLTVKGTTTGRNTAAMSGLAFTVGLKRGPFKHTSSRHYGA